MSEENERLYEEAQRRLREVTTLYEASRACLSISDQKGLLTAIIEAAARATDATLGSVMLVDEEKGEYTFEAHYGLSEETIAAIEARLHIPLGEGLVGAVAATGQPLVLADVTTDPRWIPTETKELMRSFLGVPLVGRDGHPVGALNLARPDVGAFDEDHARLLSTFANQAAMAIENAHLYEQAQKETAERKRAIEALQQRTAQLEALRQVSLELTAQLDLDGLLRSIVSQAVALLGATSGGLYLYRPERDVLEWTVGTGAHLAPIGAILRRGEGLSGKVWESGEPLIVDDYQHWERRAAIYEGYPFTAVVGVPVRWGDEFLGVLNVLADSPRAFSPADAELLRLFATQAAIAIENARLYEQTKRRLNELSLLNEVALISASTLDFDEILKGTVESLHRRLGLEVFGFLIVDEEAGELRLHPTYLGIPPELKGFRMPLGEGITGWVAQSGQPLLTPDVSKEPRYFPAIAEVRSEICVPLKVGQKVIGVIDAESTHLNAFSEDDLRLLSTLAGQLALSLENARLYERVRWSEERYRDLFENANDLIFTLDRDFNVSDANKAGRRLTGYSGEEARGMNISRFLPPKDLEQARLLLADLLAGERAPRPFETEIIRKDGGKVLCEVTSRLIEKEGEHVGVHCIARDVTERKRAEEALRESEERYRALYEDNPSMYFTVDAEGTVLSVNRFGAEQLGYTVEELVGQSVLKVFYEDDEEAVRQQLTACLQNPMQVARWEFRKVRKDGSMLWVKEAARAVRGTDGNPVVLIVCEDVTERKRAEEALRESETKYKGIVENTQDVIMLTRPDGIISYMSPACNKVLGYDPEDLVGQQPWIIHLDNLEKVKRIHYQALKGESGSDFEYRIKAKTGETKWVSHSWSPIFTDDKLQMIVSVVRDITEQKRLEAQLRQAQKMEAIGTLAGGIAHDFNNLLTSILGFASVVHSELPADSLLRSDVETIIRSARRGSGLTRQLLAFARRAQVEVYPLSLNNVVREVIGLLEHTIDKTIVTEPHLAGDLSIVEGDAGQLHQMLLNLCLNARDAMPDGGRLIIETQNVILREEKARAELDLDAGQYALLSVTDTGIGMDAETQQRLFEPFFTTKEQGRGLGLAMVYGIVRGHGGAIHVYSEPGQGSTFKVYLPVASHPTEDTAAEEGEVVGGTETVLVVEDEESVRALLQRILEEGGYTVLLAADGIEATELYAERSTEIDLVVLDIIMPRMGGQETYRRLREIEPEVKVLLSSGYSENGQAQDILAAGARGFLQKPYGRRAVLRKVREVLED